VANETSSFDLVILGGGSGGYAAAFRASELGLSVALIEKDKVGGTCLHRGCIPTKALLHAAEIADKAREGEQVGVKSTFQGIDVAGVHKYKDSVIAKNWRGIQGLVKAHGITYVDGQGKLVSPTAVEVDSERYEGKHIVLATGATPRSLPDLEIDGHHIITSEHALELDHVPASVIVLGGGVIGVEFASVWKSFGAEITIVEAFPHLLPLEDEHNSKLIERAYRRRGIALELNARVESAKTSDAGVVLSLEGGKTLEAELLLVAVGRGPVSAGLGYEEAGVQMERGFVLVDEYCRTNVPTISAVGDLIPTLQLAHVAFAEGFLVAERIAGQSPVPIDYDGVPRITCSEPEVAAVGLSEAKAKEKYGADAVKTLVHDLSGNAKSAILKTSGAVKLISLVDGPVVGIHIVGTRVSELIAEAQLIYNWGAVPSDVAQLIHPHPTQTEAIGEAHMALAGQPLHMHG
jgi:dihydrolipoamide dehydrogenase